MTENQNNNNKKTPFKQNPFLTFALLVIGVMIVFKLFSPTGDILSDRLSGNVVSKEVSRSRFCKYRADYHTRSL